MNLCTIFPGNRKTGAFYRSIYAYYFSSAYKFIRSTRKDSRETKNQPRSEGSQT